MGNFKMNYELHPITSE